MAFADALVLRLAIHCVLGFFPTQMWRACLQRGMACPRAFVLPADALGVVPTERPNQKGYSNAVTAVDKVVPLELAQFLRED